MGTNRLSHASGTPALSGPVIPSQALIGSVANPPSDAGLYLYDTDLQEYFVSNPGGDTWIRCSSAQAKITVLSEANTALARAESHIVFYNPSAMEQRLVLPSSPLAGDSIQLIGRGASAALSVGEALANALILDPGSAQLWGSPQPQSLSQAAQSFSLIYNDGGWW